LKLVDTNVFIYAVGGPHEYKEICSRLVPELIAGKHDANIDTELLQEILHRFWQRRRHKEGLEVVDRLALGFPDPFPITLRESRLARDILSTHPLIAPRDAIHAAVVVVHGLEGIITADGDFDRIGGVTRFDPMDL
jgi:predicted nucleic acid-binding protein